MDVVTKLYVATDSNPVDVHTYELCSDLVDVVIDVSYIYGLNITENNGPPVISADGISTPAPPTVTNIPYDDKSTAAIRLNSGMVLYLRHVSSFLALVCVVREEYFAKRALLDYNINCFCDSLSKVCNEKKINSNSNSGGGGGVSKINNIVNSASANSSGMNANDSLLSGGTGE